MASRSYTLAQWAASNYVGALNEVGIESDTGRRKVFDGITGWNLLPYAGGNAATAPPLLSGQYYPCNSQQANAVTNTLGNGSARVSRWEINEAITIVKLGTDFTIAGADAGALFRFGIWKDDGNGRPGALLLDAGTVSVGSGATPGNIEVTVNQAMPPGRWVHVGGALQGVSGAQPTMRIVNANCVPSNMPMGSSAPAAGVAVCGYAMSGQTGAFGAFAFTSQSVSIPRIYFKTA